MRSEFEFLAVSKDSSSTEEIGKICASKFLSPILKSADCKDTIVISLLGNRSSGKTTFCNSAAQEIVKKPSFGSGERKLFGDEYHQVVNRDLGPYTYYCNPNYEKIDGRERSEWRCDSCNVHLEPDDLKKTVYMIEHPAVPHIKGSDMGVVVVDTGIIDKTQIYLENAKKVFAEKGVKDNVTGWLQYSLNEVRAMYNEYPRCTMVVFSLFDTSRAARLAFSELKDSLTEFWPRDEERRPKVPVVITPKLENRPAI